MFEINIPQSYQAVAQDIMGRIATEVTIDNFGEVLEAYMNAATSGAKGDLRIQAVRFDQNGHTERDVLTRNIGIVRSALIEDNSALMLSNQEGAVFCLNYVKVGDKEYIQFLNPQAAKDASNEMAAMFQNVEAPKELSLWEKICDWFAQRFRSRPGEAAGRAEAYRSFYENMQKGVEQFDKLSAASAAQNYKGYRSVSAEAEQLVEEVQQPVVEQPVEEIQQPDNAAQNVNEEPQTQEEPPVKARRIRKEMRKVNEESQRNNILEASIYEEVEIDLDALDEEIAREEEERARQEKALQEEKQRQYDEAVQKRNEALKAKTERIKSYKETIKEYEEKLSVMEPKAIADRERVSELQKQMFALGEYDLARRGKWKRINLVKNRDQLEQKLEKINKKLETLEKEKKLQGNEENVAKKVEKKKVAVEKAKERLVELEGDLRSAQMALSYMGGQSMNNGTWLTAEEFLAKKYKEDKARRDRKFESEQNQRDEKIAEAQNKVDIYQGMVDKFTDKLGYWSRNKEEEQQLASYKQELKDAKSRLEDLKKADKEANKQHDKEDKDKQKELLSPSKELLAQTNAELTVIKEEYRKVWDKHTNVATAYDLAKQTVSDKEEAYEKELAYYNKNYVETDTRFDGIQYARLSDEKKTVARELQDANDKITEFDAIADKYEETYRELVYKRADIEPQTCDLEIKVRIMKEKLAETKEKLALEEAPLPSLNLEDPDKQKDGLSLGGM